MTEVPEEVADELSRLRAELAAAKAETQRVREQLSLDVAEAKVETGRAVRQLNDMTRKLRETEAERKEAFALVLGYRDARTRIAKILEQLAQSMNDVQVLGDTTTSGA